MKCIPIAQLMADTGYGPITTRRLVRAGALPGEMIGRRYLCTPGEYERWLRGEWTPRPQPQPVKLLHERKVS